MIEISSRDNPLLKELRRLSHDSTAYRKTGRVWLEGDHLCQAALARGVQPVQAVFARSEWAQASPRWRDAAAKTLVVPDELFDGISQLESPARMGFVIELPAAGAVQSQVPTVVRFCAAPRHLVFARCWPSRARQRCGRPRFCVPAWVRISVCNCVKGWQPRTWPR